MSERNDYPAGVPCWVENLQSDVEQALNFYGRVMGWEFGGPGAGTGGCSYYVARMGGSDVAGIGSKRDPACASAWGTFTSVDDVDETAAVIVAAGGTLFGEPFSAGPAGRGAIFADPTGAIAGIWESETIKVAHRVNGPGSWAVSRLLTDDPAAASEFYKRVFGWETVELELSGLKLWEFRLPGYVGGDVVATMMESEVFEPSTWGLDIWVDDVERVVKEAIDLGGRVPEPIVEFGPFQRAVIRDPGGATFFASQLR